MPHKCELNITVHVPVGHPSQSLRCSQIITTYAGLFHDPCQVEGECFEQPHPTSTLYIASTKLLTKIFVCRMFPIYYVHIFSFY